MSASTDARLATPANQNRRLSAISQLSGDTIVADDDVPEMREKHMSPNPSPRPDAKMLNGAKQSRSLSMPSGVKESRSLSLSVPPALVRTLSRTIQRTYSHSHSHPTQPPQPKPLRALRAIGYFLLEQWNLLTMGLLILLAYFFPYVGTTGGAIRAEYTISWGAVCLIFLIAGLSLSPTALLKGIPHWRAHLVSNVFSFLISPAVMFAFASAGQRAHLDFYVLAGMVVAGTMPTTIASNVTCTLNARGSTELASIEVVIGNVLGTFITPLLAQMFLSAPNWAEASPGEGGSVTSIYIRMAKQLSATLFAPLIAGLIIQLQFPRPVARIRTALHLNKVASLMTTLCVWHNFCKAFYSGAFKSTSHATIIYLCFMGLATYIILSVFVFSVLRLPGIDTTAADWWRFTKRDAIALCFCAPAKGVAVGSPLIAILYSDEPIEAQAKLALALLIYNGEQVAVAQLVVPMLRWWARDEIERDKELEEEAKSKVSGEMEKELPDAIVSDESDDEALDTLEDLDLERGPRRPTLVRARRPSTIDHY